MDLRNGWKYVLDHYPQVNRIRSLITDVLLMVSIRLTPTVRSPLAQAMVVMLSSRPHPDLQGCVDN